MDKPKLAVLIFSSGKVNFVGIKKKDDAFEALKNIQPIIQKYKIVIKNKNDEAKEKEFNNIRNS